MFVTSLRKSKVGLSDDFLLFQLSGLSTLDSLRFSNAQNLVLNLVLLLFQLERPST